VISRTEPLYFHAAANSNRLKAECEFQVSENKVLKKIFEPKGNKVKWQFGTS
jgi:hypothetical protein